MYRGHRSIGPLSSPPIWNEACQLNGVMEEEGGWWVNDEGQTYHSLNQIPKKSSNIKLVGHLSPTCYLLLVVWINFTPKGIRPKSRPTLFVRTMSSFLGPGKWTTPIPKKKRRKKGKKKVEKLKNKIIMGIYTVYLSFFLLYLFQMFFVCFLFIFEVSSKY